MSETDKKNMSETDKNDMSETDKKNILQTDKKNISQTDNKVRYYDYTLVQAKSWKLSDIVNEYLERGYIPLGCY